jgi:hypothetical protein
MLSTSFASKSHSLKVRTAAPKRGNGHGGLEVRAAPFSSQEDSTAPIPIVRPD